VIYDDGTPLPDIGEVMTTRRVQEQDPTEWLDFNFPVGKRVLIPPKEMMPRMRLFYRLLLQGSRVADILWWTGGPNEGMGRPSTRDPRLLIHALRRFCRRTGFGIQVRKNKRSARLYLLRPSEGSTVTP
jgi:hypothetical protein